jgi:hypothetical protein
MNGAIEIERSLAMKRGMKNGMISLTLVVAMLLSPVIPALRSQPMAGHWSRLAAGAVAQAQETKDNTIFLPLITQPLGPPAFEIISPGNGWTVGGMMYFAVQASDPATVASVTFQAGATMLGTDADPADGFRVFFDASEFPAGALQLVAVARGPGGETTKTVTVNVVPNPPASATVGPQGEVLATEIGSVITIPPSALPDGTSVTVTERTQAEVTARQGIQWEALGVTFLGAQEIQAGADFAQPLGVASADFGNRVQPG